MQITAKADTIKKGFSWPNWRSDFFILENFMAQSSDHNMAVGLIFHQLNKPFDPNLHFKFDLVIARGQNSLNWISEGMITSLTE